MSSIEDPLERHARVRTLFEEALRLEGDAREDFLGKTADDDPSLIDQVRELLATYDESGGATLSAAAPTLLGTDDPWSRFVEQLEKRRPAESRYDDQGEIARGGMGQIRQVFDKGNDFCQKITYRPPGRGRKTS